ncbi:hypothetical protein K502DRAFT_350123 [Neoconidiobolus thromboides FSU 785]|nr:hypothetical protein K502DRAFT_350123 [Neoconidiobolus thromboides FSU 785]
MEGEFSSQTCDRCSKWKKKCSRHIDGCIRCLMSNVKCAYSMIKQRKRRFNLEIKLKLDTGLPTIRSLQLPSDSSFEIKLERYLLKSPLIVYFMGLSNISKDTKLPQERLTIINMLGALNKFRPDIFGNRKNNYPAVTADSPLAIYGSEELYQSCCDAYFTYFNTYFPLFCKKTFLKKEDRMIKLVVLASGIRFLKIKVNFLDLLHQEIYTLVSRRLFKPSLSLIQALFIISYFLYSTPIFFKLIRYSAYSLLGLCYSLGLPYKKDLESKLTWLTLINYKRIGMLLSRTIVPESLYHGHILKNIKDEELNIRYQGMLQQNILVSQIFDASKNSQLKISVLKLVQKMNVILQTLKSKEDYYPYLTNMGNANLLFLIIKTIDLYPNLKSNFNLLKYYQASHLQLIYLQLKYKGVPLLADQFFILTSTISSLMKSLNLNKIQFKSEFKQTILDYYSEYNQLPQFVGVVNMHLSLIDRLTKAVE